MDADIEIEIGAGTDAGNYAVRVIRAAAGGEPSGTLMLDTEEILDKRELVAAKVLASAVPQRSMSATEQPVRKVGSLLFQKLFQERVYGTYRASLGVARQRGEQLRVVLRLTAPGLAALPWETLFDPETETYLCRQEPLVRHVPAPYTVDPLEVHPPLRILGLAASPQDLEPLDVDAEKRHLAEALADPIADGLVEVTWVPSATWPGVQNRLLSGEWHVLHFVGHGDYDIRADEGLLALVGSDGNQHLVEADRFADLLGEAQPAPRLVVLNSCSSGESGPNDIYSGIAATLVRRGISAVTAMQFPISDSAAIAFARGFYTAIARGRSVDRAVRSGRVSILGARTSLEWITPVLYVRGQATQLFTMTRREPSLAQQTAPKDQPGGHLVDRTGDLKDTLVAAGTCQGWIDSPGDGETVGTRIVVRGGARNVPDGRRLWIAHRVDPGGLLWPKHVAITPDDNGRFDVNTYEGGSSPRLYITLLLVSASVSADFDRWISEGSRTGHYPGLRLSPGSYEELASVSVRHSPAHGQGTLPQPQQEPIGQERAQLSHPGELQALALSPDGTQLATICGDTVFLWELATSEATQLDLQMKPKVMPRLRRAASPVGRIATVAFSRDGTRLAAVGGSSALVWDVAARQELGRYYAEPLGAAAFSLDIDRLALAAGNSGWIWEVAVPGGDGEFKKMAANRLNSGSSRALSHPAAVKAMAFSPDGVRLATVSGMTARLWEVSSRRELVRVKGPSQLARTLAFSRDGTRLATVTGGTTQVWDMTGREIARLERGDDIRAVIFGSDGNFLTTISRTAARLWDLNKREVTWTGDIGSFRTFVLRPDGRYFSAAGGNTIRMSKVGGSEMATLNAVGDVTALAVSRDETRLATVSGTTAQVWAV